MELVRKRIKHIHIRVFPPDGRIRVTAPLYVGEEAIRHALLDRLSWIRKKQAFCRSQVRQPGRTLETGEKHWFEGREYVLELVEGGGRQSVDCREDAFLILRARPFSTLKNRERLLREWYRDRLKERIPPLLAKWEPTIGVKAAEWGIKAMRTRWGTCNTQARRIWLNLELVKKPPACLEYVVVHELVHLLERSHNSRFKALMDGFLPDWREKRKRLNGAPPGQDSREC